MRKKKHPMAPQVMNQILLSPPPLWGGGRGGPESGCWGGCGCAG